MFKFKKMLSQKEAYLKKYCKQLKNLKNDQRNINKLNELILSKIKYLNIKSKGIYPENLYTYINEYYINNGYRCTEDNLIECLNIYRKNNKYHFLYWELEDLKYVLYYIFVDKLCSIIKLEPNDILSYNPRKEKIIYNLLCSIEVLEKINFDVVIVKVSDTEQLLLRYEEYQNLNDRTRMQYRQKIKVNSAKNHLHEYFYVDQITKNKKLISSALFKRINYRLVNVIIIVISLFLSTLSCFLLANYLKIYENILLFFINYFFIYQVLSFFIPKEFIPQYNLAELPPTLCYKYTILDQASDVDKYFTELENYYLNHKNDNLHFLLLVDATDCDHQIEPFDNEILNRGKEKCLELCKKYNQELFYFVYRKRVFDKGIWHGYNRKNGAIEQLIKIICQQMDLNIAYKYFMGYTPFNTSYKYLFELDNNQDVNVLINTLEHPYNKATYKKNKILYGYSAFTTSGCALYGNYYYQHNLLFSLEDYNKNLIDKMPSNILPINLLRCGVLKTNYINDYYNDETILKNNIQLFLWTFSNSTYFNINQKLYFFHQLLSSFISIICFGILCFLYISKINIFIIDYLAFMSFIFLPYDCFISLKTLLSHFSLRYRNRILESRKKYVWSYCLSIPIFLFLGFLFKVDIVSIITVVFIATVGIIWRWKK